MTKKIISMLLCISMFTMPAFATNFNVEQPTPKMDAQVNCKIATPVENGVYQLISANTTESKSLLNEAERDAFEVFSEDNTIYYNTQNADLFMAVDEDTVVKASEILIDPYDLDAANQLIDRYNLSEKMAEDIRAIISLYISGEATPEDDLRVYVPQDTSAETRESAGSYYFTGYKGQRYYQELLHFSRSSEPFAVYKQTTAELIGNYLTSSMKNLATTVADGAIGTIVGPAWTFISAFANEDAAALNGIRSLKSTYSHTAVLHENKYIKYTFVATSVGNLLGAVTEFTDDYHFQDLFNVPGYTTYIGENGPTSTAKAEGYYNADELAYYHYPSGYTEYISRIESYKYQNTTKNISITVSTLIR